MACTLHSRHTTAHTSYRNFLNTRGYILMFVVYVPNSCLYFCIKLLQYQVNIVQLLRLSHVEQIIEQ